MSINNFRDFRDITPNININELSEERLIQTISDKGKKKEIVDGVEIQDKRAEKKKQLEQEKAELDMRNQVLNADRETSKLLNFAKKIKQEAENEELEAKVKKQIEEEAELAKKIIANKQNLDLFEQFITEFKSINPDYLKSYKSLYNFESFHHFIEDWIDKAKSKGIRVETEEDRDGLKNDLLIVLENDFKFSPYLLEKVNLKGKELQAFIYELDQKRQEAREKASKQSYESPFPEIDRKTQARNQFKAQVRKAEESLKNPKLKQEAKSVEPEQEKKKQKSILDKILDKVEKFFFKS